MNRPLSRSRSRTLGLFVCATLAVAGWGLWRVTEKSARFRDGESLSVLVHEAPEVEPGTIVRVRGVEAGRVSAVTYEGEAVRLDLRIDRRFRESLFADASATIKSKGLLGTSVVEIAPGHAEAGPLTEPTLASRAAPDLAEVTAKLQSIAGRVDGLLADVEQGRGTLPKLLRDDTIYNDLKAISSDSRKLVRNLDDGVTLLRTDATKTLSKIDKSMDQIHGEVDGLKTFVRSGQEAVTAIKQDAEAIKSLPIVRGYVEDPVSILVRPDCSRERYVWSNEEIFEPGTSTLTAQGRARLEEAAGWFNGQQQKNSEVVVAVFENPQSKEVLPAAARTLTKKQAETITEFLRERGVHKMGWFTRRKLTPVGHGFEPSPVAEKEKLAPARVELILFVPRS